MLIGPRFPCTTSKENSVHKGGSEAAMSKLFSSFPPSLTHIFFHAWSNTKCCIPSGNNNSTKNKNHHNKINHLFSSYPLSGFNLKAFFGL